MTITLKPEDEQIIQRRLQTGAFSGVEDVIHRALKSLDAEEDWLQANKEAIGQKISHGVGQLDRGEGIPGDVARKRLQQKKAAWQARQRS
ncbi:MAG: type II toxin-antitoxin system ParD family antitoxin [Acidobacteria bacterium]|nr:type II toxin-antitoxin system ParD family antitoxin [Acidobacteriota bacterium]